ncbi:MAG: HigA family addiction module antidote protein [Bacteroidales bacterium]|nr:HigA family addiction module antidote protein [Bacteroidales bacterium]
METKNEKMVSLNGASPAMLVHPGSILGEELKARNIRQKDFADAAGLQATHLSALIHGVRNFTPEIATKIESGLPEIPASFWMKLQAQYNLDKARKMPTSRYVDGYFPKTSQQPMMLRDIASEKGYNNKTQVTLSIPPSDWEILRLLCLRFGWEWNRP